MTRAPAPTKQERARELRKAQAARKLELTRNRMRRYRNRLREHVEVEADESPQAV